MNISKRVQNIEAYIFSQLLGEAKQVEEKTGRPVLNLATGNPTFPVRKELTQAFEKAIKAADAHLYPGYRPLPELSRAILDWYQKRFGVSLSSKEILHVAGAKDALSHLPLAILNPGDEILVPNPGYTGFKVPIELAGGVVVEYELNKDFTLDLESIAIRMRDKTKAIIVNFPSNPTGQVASKQTLKDLVRLAKENNVIIIYDNAYAEITFDDYKAPSILEIDGAREVAIEIQSFSKSFSMAGFRLGWIAGNEELVQGFAKLKSQIDSGVTKAIQIMGTEALSNFDPKWHQEMLEYYRSNAAVLVDKIKTLGLEAKVPKASLYIWTKLPDGENHSFDYSMRLLKEKNILLTPGSAYGSNGEGYVRISIASDISNINNYI